MTYKSIFLVLDNSSASENSQEIALSLAQRFDAQITALSLAIEPIVPSIGMHPVLLDALEIQRQASIKEAQRLQYSFEDAAINANVNFESRTEICPLNDCAKAIFQFSLCSDLVVMCASAPDEDRLGSNNFAEKLMSITARPVLVVPPRSGPNETLERGSIQTQLGRRIIIAWNASREAARAASEALPLLKQAETVRVICIDLEGGIHSEVTSLGTDLARFLARHDCNVETRTLKTKSGDVGEALIAETAEFGADLLVMGAYGHSRLRELALGGVTQAIFKSLRTPVLMAH